MCIILNEKESSELMKPLNEQQKQILTLLDMIAIKDVKDQIDKLIEKYNKMVESYNELIVIERWDY